MYKYFISWRYIFSRLISLFTVIGVALGVTVLLVALAVIDGFKQEFKVRLQGSLSDLIVSVRSQKKYEEIASKIEENPQVVATSPRINGLVLVGTGDSYAGARVIGIDYEKERQATKLEDYIVTPYKETKLMAEKFFEDNVIEERKTSLSWKVLGGGHVKKDGQYPEGMRIICREERKITRPYFGGHRVKENHKAFTFNTQNQIIFVEEIYPEDVEGNVQNYPLSSKEMGSWQTIFQEIKKALHEHDLPMYMGHFSEKLRLENGIDPDNPLSYEEEPELRPILLGYDLMVNSGLKRGDEIALVTGDTGRDNELKPVSRKFVVAGAFRSGWQEIDARICYTRRSDMLGFLRSISDVTHICVKIKNPGDGELMKFQLSELLNRVSPDRFFVERWEDRRRVFLTAIDKQRNIIAFILFLTVILALVMITIVLILLVTEKIQDIGILKSMGATNSGIMMLFISNGVFITFCGTLMGIIGGYLLCQNINAIADYIFQLTGFQIFPKDIYYLDHIPANLTWEHVIHISVTILSVSFVACMLPAFKAAQLDVLKALTSQFYISEGIVKFFRDAFFSCTSFFRRKKNVSAQKESSEEGSKIFFGALGVHHEYPSGDEKLKILQGIDLKVEKGECVAILGTSGEGKSTLLHILGLLETPCQGKVFFQGERWDSLSPALKCEKRNRNVGFIFQFYHLLPEFNALENIEMAARIREDWGKVKKVKKEKAKRLLKEVGLEDRWKHRPVQLSGGERQRVAIARALMNDPEIILCDEPTGNLDEENSAMIQDLLWKFNKEKEQTFIIVTHDKNIAKRADRAFELVKGHLVLRDL